MKNENYFEHTNAEVASFFTVILGMFFSFTITFVTKNAMVMVLGFLITCLFIYFILKNKNK